MAANKLIQLNYSINHSITYYSIYIPNNKLLIIPRDFANAVVNLRLLWSVFNVLTQLFVLNVSLTFMRKASSPRIKVQLLILKSANTSGDVGLMRAQTLKAIVKNVMNTFVSSALKNTEGINHIQFKW